MEYFRFPNSTVLYVYGKDATRYLNARLSNDISLCSIHKAIPAAALTAQGKTEAYFTAWKKSDGYYLYCPEGSSEAIIAAFRRFIVADQVTVEPIDSYALLHCTFAEEQNEKVLGFPIEPSDFAVTEGEHGTIAVVCKRLGSWGVDLFVVKENLSQRTSDLKQLSFQELDEQTFQFKRIYAQRAAFPYELNEGRLFAEAGIEEAVSFSKGCYVGQETLEMIAARGKVPAVNRSFICPLLLDDLNGSSVYLDKETSKEAGSVLSMATCPKTQRTACFVRLKNAFSSLNEIFIEGNRFVSVKD